MKPEKYQGYKALILLRSIQRMREPTTFAFKFDNKASLTTRGWTYMTSRILNILPSTLSQTIAPSPYRFVLIYRLPVTLYCIKLPLISGINAIKV